MGGRLPLQLDERDDPVDGEEDGRQRRRRDTRNLPSGKKWIQTASPLIRCPTAFFSLAMIAAWRTCASVCTVMTSHTRSGTMRAAPPVTVPPAPQMMATRHA